MMIAISPMFLPLGIMGETYHAYSVGLVMSEEYATNAIDDLEDDNKELMIIFLVNFVIIWLACLFW